MTASGWMALLPAAMVGTDRHTGPAPSLPVPAAELGAQLSQLSQQAGSAPATALLRIAAVRAVCSLAGAQGPLQTGPLPEPAPEDAWPAAEPGAVHDALRWALHEGPARLHHSAFRLLGAAQHRLPNGLLPQALELGRRSVALRAALLPVLGERGLWLAAQHSDWRYAVAAAPSAGDAPDFGDLSLEQRRAFLLRERQQDPAAARTRLQQTLPELPAKERAVLVTVLGTNLGAEDEDLIDELRADRSREVRQAALALLLQLPQAAHPRRAAARVAALLSHERVLLRRRWQIDAPQHEADDWKADQVDADRPQHDRLGARAWWLYQLVRQVPLGWWVAHTGLSPAELLAWAADTDWADALLRGWRDVLFAAPDAAWCDALLQRWPQALQDSPSAVLALLSPAQREPHLKRWLQDAGDTLHQTLAQVLAACPAGETLTHGLSGLLVERVLAHAEHLNTDFALRNQLPELACALHPDAMDRLAAMPRRADESPSCAQTLHMTEQVIAARRTLLTRLSRTP